MDTEERQESFFSEREIGVCLGATRKRIGKLGIRSFGEDGTTRRVEGFGIRRNGGVGTARRVERSERIGIGRIGMGNASAQSWESL